MGTLVLLDLKYLKSKSSNNVSQYFKEQRHYEVNKLHTLLKRFKLSKNLVVLTALFWVVLTALFFSDRLETCSYNKKKLVVLTALFFSDRLGVAVYVLKNRC